MARRIILSSVTAFISLFILLWILSVFYQMLGSAVMNCFGIFQTTDTFTAILMAFDISSSIYLSWLVWLYCFAILENR